MAPTIRPKSLKWENQETKAIAPSALGEFSAVNMRDAFWYARLNDDTFPIIYETEDEAKAACEIAAYVEGHPKNANFTWIKNDVGGSTVETFGEVYHTVQSKTISGHFLMGKNGPVSVPLASKEEAMEACSQYLTCVWYELSEVVP